VIPEIQKQWIARGENLVLPEGIELYSSLTILTIGKA
jgi:hypothetical protein